LHCQDCCDKILKNIPFDKELKNGVKDLVFNMEAQTVTVTYDANKTDVPALQKAFAKIGKPAATTAPEHKHDEHGQHSEHHGHQH
jgi:copper chaperone CopZ